MYTYGFEKLDVWHLSRQLIKEIYLLTEKFPREEKYGLTAQIRDASVSVSNNLAEGSARRTPKDQSKFTTTSFSSLMEVLNLLIVSNDLKIIKESDYLKLRPLIEEISNKLNSLRKSQNKKQ